MKMLEKGKVALQQDLLLLTSYLTFLLATFQRDKLFEA
jgi:hypothetical protein